MRMNYTEATIFPMFNLSLILTNLASIVQSQGKLENALDYLQQSLKIKEKVLPKNHLEIALTFHAMGGVKFMLGKLQEAYELFKRVLVIYKNA